MITTIPDALESLRNGLAIAQTQLKEATTEEQRQMARFWIDYFARQITKWEAKR